MQEEEKSELYLPSNVFLCRKNRLKAMISVSIDGILIRSFIVISEWIGYLYFQSSSLFVDAIGSLIDIATSLSFLFFIRLAYKPPDEKHPLGHGRFEPIAGMQLAVFLTLMGVALSFRQFFLLIQAPSHPPLSGWAWLIPFGALLFLELAYRRLRRVAKDEKSSALLAEALHYRIDAVSSLVATAVLAIGAFIPTLSGIFDHLGALCIGIIMVILGCYATRQNVDQLVDRIPEEHYFDLVRKAALKVEGIKGTEKLRIQLYGPDAHVSIDVEVDPQLSVIEAHLIAQKVRLEIQRDFPSARDVIVHVEPYESLTG